MHELGEFVDTYAGEEYEKIREAAMNTSAQVLGANTYNRTLNNYQRTYEKLNKNQSALDEAIKNYKNTEETKGEETVKNSLSVDSEGNALSEEQQEYFKDSKIRDEQGRLKVMYHGTGAEFYAFDPIKTGGKTGKNSN